MDKFMTTERAASIARKVKDLKSLWQRRNAAMMTLGTASYLDGSNSEAYVKMSEKSNPLMREHFGELLEDVRLYFQERCPGSTVKYKENAALPGFHVFDCNKLFSMPVASVHKDLQWMRLTFDKKAQINSKYTMSFTLSLELPPGGGGLYTFDSPDLGMLSYLVPRSLLHSMAKKTRIDYKVGYMVVHNGMTFHMIAPCKPSPDSYRLTLQGHGVYEKTQNTWWLYW
jgi:hypothetical protein